MDDTPRLLFFSPPDWGPLAPGIEALLDRAAGGRVLRATASRAHPAVAFAEQDGPVLVHVAEASGARYLFGYPPGTEPSLARVEGDLRRLRQGGNRE